MYCGDRTTRTLFQVPRGIMAPATHGGLLLLDRFERGRLSLAFQRNGSPTWTNPPGWNRSTPRNISIRHITKPSNGVTNTKLRDNTRGRLRCLAACPYRGSLLADEFLEGEIGAPGEIRTPDPLVRSQVLYPTELRARDGCAANCVNVDCRSGAAIIPNPERFPNRWRAVGGVARTKTCGQTRGIAPTDSIRFRV